MRRWSGLFGSMRVRIVATVVLLLLASSIVSDLVLRQVLFDRLEGQVTDSLRQEAEEFRSLSVGNDPRTGRPFGDDFQAVFDVYFEREVPDEGESLLAFLDGELYRSERAGDAAAADEVPEAVDYWLSLDNSEQSSISTPLGEARYVAIPLRGNGQQQGMFVVANFPAFERSEIDDAVQAQTWAQLGAVALASLLGLALAGRVLRPLRFLAETARRISDTDLARRIPVRGNDEASQIAAAFNDMLARLEHAFATQRRFLDDAGHELRTPLTVIRGHVELLELDTDPEARRETATLITAEIDRMNRIVNDLLLLASAEQPDFVHFDRLKLPELMAAIHRNVNALAQRDWVLEYSPDATIRADPQRLTQAMMQLADNARRHTEEGDEIRIGAAVRDDDVHLWVHDTGPGVASDDAERIFQRFTRASKRGGDGGAGLGLSIVQAIAEAHGGKVRLAPSNGHGARFEIVIPARPIERQDIDAVEGAAAEPSTGLNASPS